MSAGGAEGGQAGEPSGPLTRLDFAYCFARVSRFYGIDPLRLLALPVRMFWTLFNEIDRLRAEEMADWLPVHLTAAGVGARELYDRLRQRVGTPLIFADRPDDGRADGEPGLTEKARTRLRARFG